MAGWSRRRYLGAVGAGLLVAAGGCSVPVGTQDASAGRPSTPTSTTGSEVTRVYEQTVRSVVLIQGIVDRQVSQGSGFVYPDPAYVLTNEHVVRGTDAIELRYSDGDWRTARVAGADVYSDLAVLRVDDPPAVQPLGLVAAPPAVGTPVVGIGSPFGLEGSASAGVVSGVNRSIPTQAGFSIPGAIQTDAAVNPGNSGGPLVAMDGAVVGIIRSAGGDNIGFAVSAPMIERVVPDLIEQGEYAHPFMGVSLQTVTPTVAAANGLADPEGILVVAVSADGPAAGILEGSDDETVVDGVRVPSGGDVIRTLAGEPVRSVDDLSRLLAFETRPGDTIPVGLVRDGARTTVELTLEARPDPADL